MGAVSRVESNCDKRLSPVSEPDGDEGSRGWGSGTLAGDVLSRERILVRTADLWASELSGWAQAGAWGLFTWAGDLEVVARGDGWRSKALVAEAVEVAGGLAGA